MKRIIAGSMALVLSLMVPALAQEGPRVRPEAREGRGSGAPATAPAATDKLAVTHGQVVVDGSPLRYTATAGYLPMKDESGKLRANFFFVAYTRDAAEGGAAATGPAAQEGAARPAGAAGRPITFLFNGGPGAAAAWLHLGTAGPYRVQSAEGAGVPTPPGKLVENASTWLTDTDLVFIDPVGTGYSRAASPEQNREFWGVSEDLASVAEFIRLYTTKYQRWDSPKFLAGESYGTTRAAALAEMLHDQQGMALNGVILISTVLNFGTIQPREGNDLAYALFLPTYTTTAFYHHKLPADLQKDFAATVAEAEKFTLNTYLPALARGSLLPDGERASLVDQLARLTGLSKDYILKSNLRIDPNRFEKALLSDPERPQIVGRMDSRVTAYSADGTSDGPDFDPALSGYLPLYTATFNSYVREKLQYENELPYELLSGRVGPWNFGGNGMSGFLYVGDNLRNAMQKNPSMQLLVCSGYYDLATPFFATDYTISHLNLPAALRENVTQAYYPGGHMFYHEASSLEKLHADVARFIQSAVKKGAARP